ncbi:Clp protease N-terminal domain-containing protein [Streptomyces tailanensis]|uniref:Clp protease N-terminal domain-containing protein n=1 Tax=Streptomyces tailanensis TaxID=2569858 RepID=UPI00122E597F|nr:Clp protease N-terminal domain-containing protein [Streptomyces tailanensis]
MFERFTKDARAVVLGAVEHAEGAGSRTVDAEHLLLALLDRRGSRGSFALSALGLTDHSESVRRALDDVRRRAGLSRAEAEALAGLGIDVSEIVSRVEEAHGVGAMSGDWKDKRWWTGHRSFSRPAKDILEKSLRIAVARRDRHIGDEHLLLALTTRPGVPAEVLADHGVTHEALERVLYGPGEAKAG